MKKLNSFFLAAVIFVSSTVCAGAEYDISAKCAIVYEPLTGTVLYEKQADERMLIASTTKIMTAVVVLERCSLDECVKIRADEAGVEGSSMHLKAGESYTVEELLYGMMLASGNDAAAALACHTAGSIEDFAALMNDKCAELGLINSHFVNPHGLDAPEHFSCARDLAVLTAYAMLSDTFRKIFSTESCQVKGRTLTNHNKLLQNCAGCIGGKTGYTDAAGRVLVSCAERGGMELICVTISAPDDWNDHITLYDRLFAEYRFVPALRENEKSIEVISGMSERVALAAECAGLVVKNDCRVTSRVFLPEFVFSPVAMGSRAGEVRMSADGVETIIPVYYAQTVLIDGSIPLTPWERFKRAWDISCRSGVYYPSM